VVLGGGSLDRKERFMARIIVAADPEAARGRPQPGDSGPVLLDERVSSIHLSDGHAAEQLIERLAWAVTDAEETERGRQMAGVS
jgi:hypothetical protein